MSVGTKEGQPPPPKPPTVFEHTPGAVLGPGDEGCTRMGGNGGKVAILGNGVGKWCGTAPEMVGYPPARPPAFLHSRTLPPKGFCTNPNSEDVGYF